MRSMLLAIALASCGAPMTRSRVAEPPAWSEWGREPFARAHAERRLILLSVQAGWCHWCHVMNDVTFRDAEVRRVLESRFVLVRAEGDARPDLAERYRNYAWPATVFLDPDGRELLALRGYRPPDRFRAILDEVLAAHREGRAVAPSARDREPPPADLGAVRLAAIAQLDAMYDEDDAGWGRGQRYPLAAPVEHAFFRAAVRGETRWRDRALETLERYALLLDPEWGGMYQYSERGVWTRPHFEKIVSVQAGAIVAFSEAYRATNDRRWLDRAESIRRYVLAFLTAPDGAFYTSQDADLGELHGDVYFARSDTERRALGVPRVGTHVYASSNGMLIEALAALASASGERAPLAQAIAAAERVIGSHRRADGLYAHDAADDGVRYLADQARMLAAFVALHQASGDPRWRDAATALADATLTHLRDPERGGLFAHTEDPAAVGVFRQRLVPIPDNAIAARALSTLARLSHRDGYREAAIALLRACARPADLRGLGRMIGEYLLALEHLEARHVLLSIVGPDDPRTAALHRAALALAEPTRLVEVGRPGASRYPYPGEPAVFLCTAEACSMPVYTPAALGPAVESFLAR